MSIVLFLCACQGYGLSKKIDLQVAEDIQEDIDQLQALYASLSIPEHLLKPGAERRGDEFDVNEIFGILDHLKMAPGYTLDYAYFYGGMDGYPVLYARKSDQDRALYRLPDRPGQGEADPEFDPFAHNPLDAIQADGSVEGFMQMAIFARMGSQFYLFWHANYSDGQVITTPSALEALIGRCAQDDFCDNFGKGLQHKAQKIDPRPEVIWLDEKVTISMVWFSKWGGFTKSSYQMRRSYPHKLITIDNQKLVDYECGIVY